LVTLHGFWNTNQLQGNAMNPNDEVLDDLMDVDVEVVDKDQLSQTEVVRLPFDVNAVKVKSQALNIGQLVELLEQKIIRFDTDFQRRPYLWDEIKQSQFIESIILNLPIPLFYFFETEQSNWEIVDGLQRISTIRRFITEDDLVLKGLEFNEDYNGKKFSELPNPIKWRIKLLSLSVSILEKGTPDSVKYLLFKRLNRGGLDLKPAEVRNAIFRNGGAQLVAHLSQLDEYDKKKNKVASATEQGLAFAKATHFKIKSDRMENREWVTRFLAFYLILPTKYEGNMELFLNDGLKVSETLPKADISKLKYDFKSAMNTAYEIFRDYTFRKMNGRNEKKKPINIGLFETLSVCLAQCNDQERQLLIERAELFKDKFIALHNEPDRRFLGSITNGTTQKENVRTRFEKIKTLVIETLQ